MAKIKYFFIFLYFIFINSAEKRLASLVINRKKIRTEKTTLNQIILECAKQVEDLCKTSTRYSAAPPYFHLLQIPNQKLGQITNELHKTARQNDILEKAYPQNIIYNFETQYLETEVNYKEKPHHLKLFNIYNQVIKEHLQSGWEYSCEVQNLTNKKDLDEWILFIKQEKFNSFIITLLIQELKLEKLVECYYHTLWTGPRFLYLWVKRESLVYVSSTLGFPIPNECLNNYKKILNPC